MTTPINSVSAACEEVWEAMRPLGGTFWAELSERERSLAIECYKAGNLAAVNASRRSASNTAGGGVKALPPVSEGMVDRAYEAFVAACEWSDWDEPEVRGYIRASLIAAALEPIQAGGDEPVAQTERLKLHRKVMGMIADRQRYAGVMIDGRELHVIAEALLDRAIEVERSTPVSAEVTVDEKALQSAVCDALLNAFPMADKVAENYAAVAVRAALATLDRGRG